MLLFSLFLKDPDYLLVATAVVVPCGVGKTFPVLQYSVDNFSYSGTSRILGSCGKQNTASAGARGREQ